MDFTKFESQDLTVSDENTNSGFAKKLPNKDFKWPSKIRVLPDPREEQIYKKTDTHLLEVNGKWINVPCLRNAQHTPCPFCDTYWEAKEESDLQPKDSLEYKKAAAKMRQFRIQRQFSFLAALEDDPVIYVFNAKATLTKEIFGSPKDNIKGAINEIRSFGVPIFDPTAGTGWVEVNKTGKMLDTKYHAQPVVIEVLNGRSKSQEIIEKKLPESIIKVFTEGSPEDLPSVTEEYEKNLWTAEEMLAFIETDGANLPSRLQNVFGGSNTKMDSGTDLPDMPESKDLPSDDDIPF